MLDAGILHLPAMQPGVELSQLSSVWDPYCTAVLKSWSDQGLIGMGHNVWAIHYKVSFQKAKHVILFCCQCNKTDNSVDIEDRVRVMEG